MLNTVFFLFVNASLVLDLLLIAYFTYRSHKQCCYTDAVEFVANTVVWLLYMDGWFVHCVDSN